MQTDGTLAAPCERWSCLSAEMPTGIVSVRRGNGSFYTRLWRARRHTDNDDDSRALIAEVLLLLLLLLGSWFQIQSNEIGFCVLLVWPGHDSVCPFERRRRWIVDG